MVWGRSGPFFILENMMKDAWEDRRYQAKRIYDANKKYVAANRESINIHELTLFAKKQDQLYLMWFDGIDPTDV